MVQEVPVLKRGYCPWLLSSRVIGPRLTLLDDMLSIEQLLGPAAAVRSYDGLLITKPASLTSAIPGGEIDDTRIRA